MHAPNDFFVVVDVVEPIVVDVGVAFVVGGLTEVVGQQISLQIFTKGLKGNKGKGPGDSVVCALHGKQISGFGPILFMTGALVVVVVVVLVVVVVVALVVVVGLAVVGLGQQTGVARGWNKPVHQ